MDHDDIDKTSGPPDPYREGMRFYRQGCYSRAVEALSKVFHAKGLAGAVARYYHGMSCRALGVLALSQGKAAEAVRHLAAAAQSLGRQGDLPNYLACLYARTGRGADCIRQTEKALTTGGDDVRTWLRHTQAQWRTGRREEAQMTLRQALRRFGAQADLHNHLGLFLVAQGRLTEARECFAQAIQADCSNPDAHCYHALASAALNDGMTALRSFQRAYELRPSDMVLAHRLALAAKAADQQGHRVVIRLPEPTAAPSRSQMGQLARYLTLEGDFVDTFLVLPPSEIDTELFGVLEAALQTALAEHSDYADLHLRTSAVQTRLGRLEEAIHHARSAVAINGRYVRARLHLAKLCTEAGLQDEALEHLEQAMACGADWADVHCAAAELMIPRGRTQEAQQHLARALQLNPQYSRAAEAMSRLAA
jgi:tetratricopeptide (TPR) repeat protein